MYSLGSVGIAVVQRRCGDYNMNIAYAKIILYNNASRLYQQFMKVEGKHHGSLGDPNEPASWYNREGMRDEMEM